jgi:anti-anti-sigma factor
MDFASSDAPRSHGGTRTITLSGEFDLYNKDLLDRTLRAAEDADVAIIDMNEVEFMDSSAISCLVRLKTAMVKSGGQGAIRLVGVAPGIARVLKICGLDIAFEITPR